MRTAFLSGLILISGLALLGGCSSDSPTPVTSCDDTCAENQEIAEFVVTNNCYWLPSDQNILNQNYLIYIDGKVTDTKGNEIGTFDSETEIISLDDGTVIENISLDSLTKITPEMVEEAKSARDRNTDISNSSSGDSTKTTTSNSSNPQQTKKVDASGYPIANYEKLSNGGAGVTRGFATRYWDACKPHCSWPEKVNQNANPYRIARSCSIKGEEIPAFTKSEDGTWLKGTVSSCDGGGAYTCIDMIPVAVNDTLAYAFGAAPGANEQGTCGKCYQIQFTGEGKYGDKPAHKLLMNKTLIIMASNVGYDVSGGQFDIMIPGGGVGLFDALSKQIGVSKSELGQDYGGFYTTCENTLGADASVAQFKDCVAQQCKSVFESKNKTLYDGCMWFVNWFEAANNPVTLYKEVECPQYLVDKYTSTINTSPNLSSAPSYQNY